MKGVKGIKSPQSCSANLRKMCTYKNCSECSSTIQARLRIQIKADKRRKRVQACSIKYNGVYNPKQNTLLIKAV